MDDNILVSIIVVTYNSALFIEETLLSIEKQDFKSLEVIITDDASKDNTIEICKEWSIKNKNKFKNIIIIENKINQGVSKNIQFGFEKAKGKFIKVIAGDDLLEADCIKANYKEIKENNDILFSDAISFIKKENSHIDLGNIMKNRHKKYFQLNNKQMLKKLFNDYYIITPTAFIRRESLKNINGFVTDYRMFEDYPTWVKVLKSNLKIAYMDKVTVKYRKGIDSISNPLENVINPNLFKDQVDFYYKYMKPEIIQNKWIITLIGHEMDLYYKKRVIECGNRKENISFTLKSIRYCNPMKIIKQAKNIFEKYI